MARWLNRSTKQTIGRANPTEMAERYPGDAPFIGGDGNAISNDAWIHLPDLSAVTGQPSYYWVTQAFPDDTVTLMDQAARDAVDAQRAADALLASNQAQKDQYTDNQIFRAQIKYVVDEINILRQATGTSPARTYGQAQQYMFDAIDNGDV